MGRIWDGLSRIEVPEGALLVVLTPHSPATGVYAANEGSLLGFGLPGISGKWAVGPVDAMGLPVIEGPLDHGALVPLWALGIETEVLAIGLAQGTDLLAIIDKIRSLSREREVFVLASAHTSACLTERAPLPYSSDAVQLESRVITDIESDCGAALAAAEALASIGGSCSRPTLEAFGTLFSGAQGNVLAYGSPFGVGYPVVTAEIDV